MLSHRYSSSSMTRTRVTALSLRRPRPPPDPEFAREHARLNVLRPKDSTEYCQRAQAEERQGVCKDRQR
ncbi:MAG: hypothetical protein KatS3mg051_0872 [Anaerolineae bacterium]|nr:MAG: hypothetical protein KatS3mg051_0872 [Anaerolineae bacterium]